MKRYKKLIKITKLFRSQLGKRDFPFKVLSDFGGSWWSLRVLNVQWTFVQHRPKRSVDQRPQGSNETVLILN